MKICSCDEQHNKHQQKKYNRVLSILLCIFIALFFLSVFMIAREYAQERIEEAAFEELRVLLAETEKEIVKPAYTNNSRQADIADKKKSEEELIIANYASMSELNDDYVGWLKISNTNIDYPVMYTPKDPEHYLRRAFDKTKSISGTPFVGEGADIDSDCFIIYGHNMGNNTIMFGTLDNYKEREFWQENKTFSFYTAAQKRTYEVFAAMETRILYTDEKGLRYYYYSGELSETDFFDLTEWLTGNALYDTDIVPANGEQILILSTCSYQTKNGRFIVAARLLSAEN